ncbi:sigma-54-dependent transcriptional regulator [Granulosicoccus sp. 3-233]|uniref:sigma-54-dependent transcriptional regulator n=1 Tax=Granulosicoccus sp. 3-233 TaxID=3417969 RepID=UPI003D33D3E1
MTHTALIIDDEADIRELIALSLDRIGLDTHTAGNLEEAENLLHSYRFDVCLTDMKLPDGNGVEFVTRIHEIQPDLPVAVITAHGNMTAAVEAMKNGAFDFVSKPVDIRLLRSLVTQALKVAETTANASASVSALPRQTTDHKQEITQPNQSADSEQETGSPAATSDKPELPAARPAENAETSQQIGRERLIGQSEPMQALRRLIGKVAKTNAPVWITGESGTGKELIARLVHENGPRADSPFIAINCGAIPSELMESELFGHRKGSFTGAHSDHDGLFKRAEGGTLFLDEVAELPLHMQVKLLRAIQERSVRPVGSSEEINVDARILSASHKDLALEVEQGNFRHDLYYRLNVICIESPSLRKRPDDVVSIAHHILHSIAKSSIPGSPARLTPDAENLLAAYAFPGNVRELENILERSVALSDDGVIDAPDLGIQVAGHRHGKTGSALNAAHVSGGRGEHDERKAILEMLESTRWNRKAAARELGMTYRQLRYRIQQYGIDTDDTGTGT